MSGEHCDRAWIHQIADAAEALAPLGGLGSTAAEEWRRSRHLCRFCRPEQFPPLPPGITLCSRCGDRMPGEWPNETYACCEPCEERLEADRAEARLMTDERAAAVLQKFRNGNHLVAPRPRRPKGDVK